MITKSLIVLLFTLSVMGLVHGFGTLDWPIADDGGLSLPFLGVGTSDENPSGLGWQLALLGLLKLGAVYYLVSTGDGHSHASQRDGTQNGGRKKRFIENFDGNRDGFFTLINSMDSLKCGKNLICQLEAKATEDLKKDEALILSLFSDTKFNSIVDLSSVEAEYHFAAKLGLTSRNQIICQQHYASCPYSSDELMNALRNSHI